jgi:superfamily II DNA or RNA helicase
VNSIKQGKALQSLIKDSVFLHGATENEVRAEWYGVFAERDDLIVIATYGIASTGISIDRIFAEIMVDAGKSFIRCIQSIGRGLRKSGDKTKVHVCDVHSKLKWSRKHYNERKRYYTAAGYPVLSKVKLKP